MIYQDVSGGELVTSTNSSQGEWGKGEGGEEEGGLG